MVSFLDDQRMTRGGGGMSELVENREHGVQQTEFLESVMSQGALIGDDGKKRDSEGIVWILDTLSR